MLAVKNALANAGDVETWVQSVGPEDPLERKWQPSPVFLLGEPPGQRNLAGYSPRGHKELAQLKGLSIRNLSYWIRIHIFLKFKFINF